ncbi:MAG: NAD(P)H-hydrate dehydratase [Clostridiales bacterium]|nr:NAD(P)H-hydrate dehydratase [Clostridiales bacterium]MCF8023518.1 NAD(P)H-hydrate dehydratase [Clostridiales bacterium]
MRAVTAAEMREMDREAIQDIGIPGAVLMENAGRHVVEICEQLAGDCTGKYFVVISGKGNNGGDGFVAARHLKNRGAEVKVYLMAETGDVKGDARLNLDIWLKMGGTVVNALQYSSEAWEEELKRAGVIIDALYGTGFKGAVRDSAVPLVNAVNTSLAVIVAADIPSGLEADTGKVNGPCIRADAAVTFGLPKIGLLTGDGPEYTGDLHVVDISIPEEILQRGNKEVISGPQVRNMLPRCPENAHKGDLGRALVIGGSPGMSGAVCLAASACARSGAGLVTAAVPREIHQIAENKLTEVMTYPLPQTGEGMIAAGGVHSAGLLEKAGAVALGPGLGVSEDTITLVEEILKSLSVPCVVDADGLNALAQSQFNLRERNEHTVITPHPGEAARLLGCSTAEIQANRPESARNLAECTGAVVVLKGAGTIVAAGNKMYINTSGNPGMASGGSGDVLTGIITALLARGISPVDAAVSGVYLHGLAGDFAAEEKGVTGIIAGDIIENIPRAFKSLSRS